MNETSTEKPAEISIPIWWKNGGGMMIRRDCLPFDHPEHPYNYIRRELGLVPEEYGIVKPINTEICPHCGHEFVTNIDFPTKNI